MMLFGTTVTGIAKAFRRKPVNRSGVTAEEGGQKAKAIGQIVVSALIVIACVILLVLKVEGASNYAYPALGVVAGYWIK
jgi:hypothetical protein